MLNKARTLVSHHLHAAIQSFNQLCRKPLASLMTVVVIAIALVLPTLFWAFTDNLQQLTHSWQRGHLSLYLKAELADAQQQATLAQVRAADGVGQVVFKSASEGLAELTRQEGMQDIMRYLPNNPLPAVIEVVPSVTTDTPAKLDALSSQLQAIAGVEQAKLDMNWLNRLHALLAFVSHAANALIVLLSLAVVLIIGNTLRLAIQNRQEEIQILKLIGATDPFIARPFLYSGLWYALAGAFLAVFLVNVFILSLGSAINQLALVYEMHYPLSLLSLKQVLLLVVFALLLGWLGSFVSIKRQLASIEPYN
ncbi:MAG: permease-like cell division protein FtsX [Legionella sp.]